MKRKSIQPRLGKRIAAARKRANITQREAAKRAGITAVYLCWVEKGKYTPGIRRVEKLAEVLGVKVAELFA